MNRMYKWWFGICFLCVSGTANACYDHMMFNPNNMGLVEGTIARMAGLVPPKPVFDVVHPSMARVQVGEKSAMTVNFS